MILISLHAFFFLCIYISNSHSHSHFYIRSHLLLLLLLLSPHNLFTFLPFYFFTFKRVPTQLLLHRDAIFRTSRRSHRYVGTQFQMHREGVKNTENPGAIPRDALSDSSNIFLSYSGLLIFCPCVRQQCKM